MEIPTTILYIFMGCACIGLLIQIRIFYHFKQSYQCWNSFNFLCLARSFIHMFSFTIYIIFFLITCFTSSDRPDIIGYIGLILSDMIVYSYTSSEICFAFNRFIALSYWRFYARTFSLLKSTVYVLFTPLCIGLPMEIYFAFISHDYETWDHFLFIFLELAAFVAISVNLTTFALLARYYCNRNTNCTRAKKNIRAYCYAFTQVIITGVLLGQALIDWYSGWDKVIFYMLGTVMKDILEEIIFLILFRHDIFRKKSSQVARNKAQHINC